MDWSSVSHVMQAIFWLLMFALFVNGYSIGSRSIV